MAPTNYWDRANPEAKRRPRRPTLWENSKSSPWVTQKLVGEKLAAGHQHVIAQAGAQWSKDPFLHSAVQLKKSPDERPAVQVPVASQRLPDFTYTGFMQIGDIKLAILNGIEYARGESLNGENYYVKEIHPTRVVIGRINGPETIQLPIAEFDTADGK